MCVPLPLPKFGFLKNLSWQFVLTSAFMVMIMDHTSLLTQQMSGAVRGIIPHESSHMEDLTVIVSPLPTSYAPTPYLNTDMHRGRWDWAPDRKLLSSFTHSKLYSLVFITSRKFPKSREHKGIIYWSRQVSYSPDFSLGCQYANFLKDHH